MSSLAGCCCRLSSHERLDLGPAEEALAAAHEGTRAAPQPIDIAGRDRRVHGVADLSCRDPLAEAHDSPVERVGCDQVLTLIGPGEGLADIGHPGGLGQVIAHARRQAVLLEERPNMLGERH